MDVQSTGACVDSASWFLSGRELMITVRRTREETATSIWRPLERFVHQQADDI